MSKRPSNCIITADPQKRAAANFTTAIIKPHFPAGLAQPALRALVSAGFSRLNDLCQIREADFAKLHGIGPHALKTIKAAMADQGLSFLP